MHPTGAVPAQSDSSAVPRAGGASRDAASPDGASADGPDDGQIVDPRPSALVQSLRAVGYTLAAAVADVVDNSVTAGATRVDVEPFWNGQDTYLTIRDDGRGMDAAALVEAMRLGTRSPLESRDLADLGRFGLGLKTASFSQCRRLTVASRAAGGPAAGSLAVRRWDLDEVTARDAWRLLGGYAPGSAPRAPLPGPSGTVVLWELLDAVVGGARVDNPRARDRFLEQVARVKAHLGIVFHRFLVGRGRLDLRVHNLPVAPWDPFLTDHLATWEGPRETLGGGDGAVTVRPFVLPHVSRLSSAEHAAAAGPGGWGAQQGFYIYRNGRLLADGGWLGLGLGKEEHYKLARIAVDLPNTVDHDWSIDVKKSRARPPEHLRDALRRIATATRTRAAEVYRHRGKVLARTAGAPEFVWLRKVTAGKISYVINRDHPLLGEVLAAVGAETGAAHALLRLLEETVPVSTIMVDSAERPDTLAAPFEGAPPAEVVSVARQVYAAFRRSGLSPDASRARVLATEPFPLHAAALAGVLTDVALADGAAAPASTVLPPPDA